MLNHIFMCYKTCDPVSVQNRTKLLEQQDKLTTLKLGKALSRLQLKILLYNTKILVIKSEAIARQMHIKS